MPRGPLARVLPWGGYALLLVLAPLCWRGTLAHALLAQMGIAIVACLAYNILLGQGGMLSFGHAVYSGLGSYLSMHTLQRVAEGGWALPVILLPLVGGLGGLGVASVLGWISTRRAGTPFAMITLGVGELVWSLALMLPEYFGGEGGLSANRVVGAAVLGLSLGPQIEMYYLIAGYTFLSTALMQAFTRTPLGRMLNAVRDNPERAAFIGYDVQRVRHLAFTISGFFMGVSGGLAALNFETVTAQSLSAARSADYLLFTVLGGTAHFAGPIVGAVLMVLVGVLFAAWSRAWLLYVGLAFMVVVVLAPGGLASLLQTHGRVLARGGRARLLWPYAQLALAATLLLLGLGLLVELGYHRQLNTLGGAMPFLGLQLDAHAPGPWLAGGLATAIGAALWAPARRRCAQALGAEQAEAAALPTPTGPGGRP